jgi:hypothetical protein
MQCVFSGLQARRLRFAPLWLSLLPLGALAQAAPVGVDAADPAVFAPPAAYRSVFADTPKGVESATVPWRKANDDVGQFERGHMDVVKWEAKNPGLSAPPVDAPAAVPPAATQAAPPMSGHMHHGGAKQ